MCREDEESASAALPPGSPLGDYIRLTETGVIHLPTSDGANFTACGIQFDEQDKNKWRFKAGGQLCPLCQKANTSPIRSTNYICLGHVYILISPAVPNLIKIGMTTRNVDERAKEISQGTGVPLPYIVAYFIQVSDCATAERLIHKELDSKRVGSNREFFAIPLAEAISVIQRVATKFPL